jgi:methyl-accepting chemotaxis protein
MNETRTFPIWLRIGLSRKLIIVALMFSGMVAGLVAFTVHAVDAQKSNAALTDFAGRQRTLAQKYTKEVLLAAQGVKTEHQATMAALIASADALIDGGDLVDNLETGHRSSVTAAPQAELRQKLIDQRGLATRLEGEADKFLHSADNDPRRAERRDSLLDLSNQLSVAADETVRMYSRHAEDQSNTLILAESLFGVLVAFGGVVISWAISVSIVVPLQRCVVRAKAVADGELRLAHLPVTSGDEVGQLTQAFNAMVDNVHDTAAATQSAVENLNAASAEILASTQQQAANTKEQAAAVQQITSTVEEISQSGKQVADRARQVVGAAEAVSTAGVAGLQAACDASRAMEAIREQAEMVADNIIALSERTQAVGEIIATVNEIAEQSNLVALNAAIEAADARDQGRRFSVVANEIKNLADQAKDATKQVRTILEQTQKGINTSVMLTEEALKRVALGRDKAELSEQTIRQMADNIQDSVYAFQQIVGATNQQQIGLEQVTQALHEIRQASLQTAASTSELEQASLNLTLMSKDLAHTREKYRT